MAKSVAVFRPIATTLLRRQTIRKIIGFAAPVVLLSCASCSSRTVSLEQSYIAEKARLVDSISVAASRTYGDPEIARHAADVPPPSITSLLAADSSARGRLDAQIRPIVGEIHMRGFDGPGRFNVATLLPGDEDTGMLDGISYHLANDVEIVVTTVPLFTSWIAIRFAPAPARDRLARIDPPPPRDPVLALAHPEVYTATFALGAAFQPFVRIPIVDAASSGVVAAQYGALANDIGEFAPDNITIAVVRRGRVFVIRAPARDTIKPMADCVATYRRDAKRDADAFVLSDRSEAAAARHLRMEAVNNAAFRQCYAEQATREPRFAKLATQVGEIISVLPAK